MAVEVLLLGSTTAKASGATGSFTYTPPAGQSALLPNDLVLVFTRNGVGSSTANSVVGVTGFTLTKSLTVAPSTTVSPTMEMWQVVVGSQTNLNGPITLSYTFTTATGGAAYWYRFRGLGPDKIKQMKGTSGTGTTLSNDIAANYSGGTANGQSFSFFAACSNVENWTGTQNDGWTAVNANIIKTYYKQPDSNIDHSQSTSTGWSTIILEMIPGRFDSIGPKFAKTATVVTGGSYGWNNTENIPVADGRYVTSTVSSTIANDSYLDITNFQMGIPSDATVTSIYPELFIAGDSLTRIQSFQMLKAGSPVGTNITYSTGTLPAPYIAQAKPFAPTFLANENGGFTLASPAYVEFGTTKYSEQRILPAGSYNCSFDEFGDTAWGEVKSCYLVGAYEDPVFSPITYQSTILSLPTLFNTTWTGAEVNDPGFGVRVRFAYTDPSYETTSQTWGTASSIGTTANTWINTNEAQQITTGSGPSASILPSATATQNDYLLFQNPGFNIPTDAVIKGIAVVVRNRQSGGSYGTITVDNVAISRNGTITGNNLAASAPTFGSSFGSNIYGGTTTINGTPNLWGTTWTAALINQANFGFRIRVYNAAGAINTTLVPSLAVNSDAALLIQWQNPTNVYANDSVYSTFTFTGSASTTTANFSSLNVTGFGFNIPTTATIVGLQATVTGLYSGGSAGTVNLNNLQFIKGGVAGGTNIAGGQVLTTTKASYTKGATNTTSGQTFGPANINASDFGVSLQVIGSTAATNRVANIDVITITVYYTMPGDRTAEIDGAICTVEYTMPGTGQVYVDAARMTVNTTSSTNTRGLGTAIGTRFVENNAVVRNRRFTNINISEAENIAITIQKMRGFSFSILESAAYTIAFDTKRSAKNFDFTISEAENIIIALARKKQISLTVLETQILAVNALNRARAISTSVSESYAMSVNALRRIRNSGYSISEVQAISNKIDRVRTSSMSLAQIENYIFAFTRKRGYTLTVQEVETFAEAIIIARKFGTSIAETFTAQMNVIRNRNINTAISEVESYSNKLSRTRSNSTSISEIENMNIAFGKLIFMAYTIAEKEDIYKQARRNLLLSTEFKNGLADADPKGGPVTATTFPDYDGGFAMGFDGTNAAYAYKRIRVMPNTAYNLSFILKMDDGGAPAYSGANNNTTDFVFNIGGNIVATTTGVTITDLGNGLYRANLSHITPATIPNPDWVGVVKWHYNSSRTFKFTAIQFEYANNLYKNSQWTGGGFNVAPTGWSKISTGDAQPNGMIDGNVIYRMTAVAQRPIFQADALNLSVGDVRFNSVYIGTIYSGSVVLSDMVNWVASGGTGTQTWYVDGVETNPSTPIAANTRLTVKMVCTTAGIIQPRVGPGSGRAVTIDVDISRPSMNVNELLPYSMTTASGTTPYQKVNTATDYDGYGLTLDKFKVLGSISLNMNETFSFGTFRRMRQASAIINELATVNINRINRGRTTSFSASEVETVNMLLSRAQQMQFSLSEVEAITTKISRKREVKSTIAEVEAMTIALARLKLMAYVINQSENSTYFLKRTRTNAISINEVENITASFNRARSIVMPIAETETVNLKIGRLRKQIFSINETQGINAALARLKQMVMSIEEYSDYKFSVRVIAATPEKIGVEIQYKVWEITAEDDFSTTYNLVSKTLHWDLIQKTTSNNTFSNSSESFVDFEYNGDFIVKP